MARPVQAKPDYTFLAALDQPIRPPRTSSFYALGLMLAAGTTLLLPLLYLLFMAAVGWAVYYHAFHHWQPLMGSGTGRILIFKFLVYLAPLLAGLVVLFFMFEPLLARQPKGAQPLALNPADNPLLYVFIQRICGAVGAPAPRRIDLDCDLNASAGFRRGFRSMLGDDLVLTIGLPLAGTPRQAGLFLRSIAIAVAVAPFRAGGAGRSRSSARRVVRFGRRAWGDCETIASRGRSVGGRHARKSANANGVAVDGRRSVRSTGQGDMA